MTRLFRSVALGVLCMSVMSIMSPVAAQERSNRRTLAGHSFIASSLVSDPFVGTYIRTITGGGRALDLQVPVYNLDGDQIASLGGNIAYFLLGLGYQQQLAKWVALRVSVSGSARLGTNHISLLAEGATAVYGGTFGATFRLIEKRRFYFSATAEARSNSLYGVSPLTFAQKVIESGGVDSTTQLLSSGDNWRLVGGLRAAYAFAPWVGLTGLVEYGPAKRFFANEEGERNTRQLTMGGLASVDLRPGTGVPIGFTGSVRYQSEGDQGDDLASRQAILGLGVFYTGRRDLSLGLEASYQRLNQRDVETKINASQIRLILRYDF